MKRRCSTFWGHWIGHKSDTCRNDIRSGTTHLSVNVRNQLVESKHASIVVAHSATAGLGRASLAKVMANSFSPVSRFDGLIVVSEIVHHIR